MASKLRAWWMLSIVLLVSNWLHLAYGSQPQVPCYFVFGDSLFDNGNNDYLPAGSAPTVNYLPYGIDYVDGATGRCSNGLNIADVIADLLGFDDPMEHFGMGSCQDVLNGVNYASAGAGILNETGCLTGELYTMDIQLYNHNITASRIAKILGGADVAKKYLSKCLYAIDMGHNDYLNNYFSDAYNTSKLYAPKQYAKYLIQIYEKQLKVLYKEGARKVAVFGLIRIGCMPSSIQKFKVNKSLCANKLNNAVQMFNKDLQALLCKLNANLAGAKFTYINSYQIDGRTNKGFKYTNESCCEVVGKGSVPCKCLSFPCANRSEYVYWDGAHFTEAKAWTLGRRAYKRQKPDDAIPYDISELVQLKLDNYDDYDINSMARI